jgi:hypothetical protein
MLEDAQDRVFSLDSAVEFCEESSRYTKWMVLSRCEAASAWFRQSACFSCRTDVPKLLASAHIE